MKKSFAFLLGTLGALATAAPAFAWIGAHGGGAWRGPNGGVAVWHGGVAAGGGWARGYGPHWGGCCWDGGVAAGLAVGAAAGLAIGTRVASIPSECVLLPSGLYACGQVYYRPYFGPAGVVYEVVPHP